MKQKKQSGFSLLELLIVLFIFSMSTLAVVFTFRPAVGLDREAEHLRNYLEVAQQQAQQQGYPIAIKQKGQMLSRWQYTQSEWQQISDQSLMLPEDLLLITHTLDYGNKSKELAMGFILLYTADVPQSPFNWQLVSKTQLGKKAVLEGNILGRISIKFL